MPLTAGSPVKEYIDSMEREAKQMTEQNQGEKFVWGPEDVQITEPETSQDQEPEVEMEQEESVEAPKAVHHQTVRGADLAISRKEISQESHKAVLKGRITLAEAKELGRSAGPDGPVDKVTTKATTPKKDKPVTLCIACGKPTKGGKFHPGGDMKMHRIADEYLRGERDLTDEQREYLETSGKLEQARERAEKKAEARKK